MWRGFHSDRGALVAWRAWDCCGASRTIQWEDQLVQMLPTTIESRTEKAVKAIRQNEEKKLDFRYFLKMITLDPREALYAFSCGLWIDSRASNAQGVIRSLFR
jgi:hypothetical protein